MGFFDFLSADKRREKRLEREIKSANNKFKPKDYRQISLQSVIQEARGGNDRAIAGLLARFAVVAEPSTEDEREKEWVYDALVDIGEDALPQIKRSLRSAESITWVQRTLRAIISEEEYKKELLSILEDFDTEYERSSDRKIQTIMALSGIPDPNVAEALIPFLEDVDETVRYQTVSALIDQAQEASREPLLKAMCDDKNIRFRNKLLEAFASLGWSTSGYKKKVEAILPDGFKQSKAGKIIKLGSY
jgi:hypothetical protein